MYIYFLLNYFHIVIFLFYFIYFESMAALYPGKIYQQSHLKIYTFLNLIYHKNK